MFHRFLFISILGLCFGFLAWTANAADLVVNDAGWVIDCADTKANDGCYEHPEFGLVTFNGGVWTWQLPNVWLLVEHPELIGPYRSIAMALAKISQVSKLPGWNEILDLGRKARN